MILLFCLVLNKLLGSVELNKHNTSLAFILSSFFAKLNNCAGAYYY